MSVSVKKSPNRVTICCRKRDSFQGPKLGSCLTLGNELSEETHVLTTQDILLGKGTWVESSRVRKPRKTALPGGSQCRVLWWFWEVDGHTVFPLDLSRTLLAGGCLWLISSKFLIRISCHKKIHANGYYGAWPGWVVPLTTPPCKMGYSGAVGSGSLGFFQVLSYTCHQQLSSRKSLLRQKKFYPREGAQYDMFPYYDIGNLVRVSDPWSEDDISDSVYSSQVKGAF